jgi:hypothetical protein
VGVREEDPARGEAVEIRGEGLGMPAEAPDPVIQVIEGDEENVGFAFLCCGYRRESAQEEEGEDESGFHETEGLAVFGTGIGTFEGNRESIDLS